MDFEQPGAVPPFPVRVESVKWGSCAVFSVGEKMFAVAGNESPATSISLRGRRRAIPRTDDRPGIIPTYGASPWVCVQ
jgi:predicted DNA-binding protein (MmcQ/YjbR family)